MTALAEAWEWAKALGMAAILFGLATPLVQLWREGRPYEPTKKRRGKT